MHENRQFIKTGGQSADRQHPVCYRFCSSDKVFGATLVELCSGGLCFLSGYAIDPGTQIYVLKGPAPAPGADKTAFKGRLARVKWCQNLPDVDAFFYEIGVEFVGPEETPGSGGRQPREA